MNPVGSKTHNTCATAFAENLALKDLAPAYPDAHRSLREVRFRPEGGGTGFIFSFGAVTFLDVTPEVRERELSRLRNAQPNVVLTPVITEEFSIRENPAEQPHVAAGTLVLDKLTPERESIIALIVAQSAAMEYYERLIEDMFGQTDRLVQRLEQRGTVAFGTRPLHRFIGTAVVTRHEVLSVLHLLDKPDEVWDDPAIDGIYDRLRAEFDLVDRYRALEIKLASIQESLEVILDVARDRRLVLLEAAIVALIVFEIVLSLIRA